VRLTANQIETFFEEGFFVLDGLFKTDVARIHEAFCGLQEIAEFLDKSTEVNNTTFIVEGMQIRRAIWCCGAAPELRPWTSDQRLLAPVSQLLAPRGEPDVRETDQIISQAHFKLPGDGVSFPWHQDAHNRRYGTELWQDLNARGSYVQTVMAIDRMTHDNGPLRFIVGSAKQGWMSVKQVQEYAAAAAPSQIRSLCLEPGSVAFFGPYVIHGSLPNNSRQSRRVWINGYAYPGANRRVYPGCGRGVRHSVPQ